MKAFALLLTLLPAAALAAIGSHCTGPNGTSGTCQKSASCTGFTVTGACPNDPSNVLCCISKSCSTSSGSGTCKNTSRACAGSFVAGACPGSASVQCCVKGGTTSPPTTGGGGAAILKAAKTQAGLPYSWGGGGCSGKSKGIDQGANTVGFDCSGLTQYAVCVATGKKKVLPRTTRGQYAANVGKRIPLAQRQVGDLIYYAHGGDCSCDSKGFCKNMYHTAIWAGDGMMFEAQKTGTKLGLHKYRSAEVCSHVMRHW